MHHRLCVLTAFAFSGIVATGCSSDATGPEPLLAKRATFTVQPGATVAAAQLLGPVRITLSTYDDRLATDSSYTVSLSLAGGDAGAVLAGTTTVQTVGGIATFTNLSVGRPGAGYRLIARVAALDSTVSSPFSVTGPTRLAFASQPVPTATSAQPLGTVRVNLLESDGRLSTTATSSVTISLASSDPAAQLAGTTTVQAVAGVASFTDLAVARAGTNYRLVATAANLEGATSQPFEVGPGAPAQLRFEAIPGFSSVRSITSDFPYTVRVTDAAGNAASTASSDITITYTRLGDFGLTTAPDGLFGNPTITAVNGVASLSGLRFRKSGSYTLTASSLGLASVTGAQMALMGGPQTHLLFVTQPQSTAAGVALPAISVQQVDEYGNGMSLPPGGSYNVTLSLGANPTGATLGGTLTAGAFGVLAVNFSTVTLDKPGTGYTIVATSGTRTVTSAPFDVR